VVTCTFFLDGRKLVLQCCQPILQLLSLSHILSKLVSQLSYLSSLMLILFLDLQHAWDLITGMHAVTLLLCRRYGAGYVV